MTTKSLIKVFDVDGSEIATIYTQADGYPEGWMYTVAEFLSSRRLVNGFSEYNEINGMDDLVAQIVTLMKLKHYEVVSEYRELKGEGIDRMIVTGGIYVMAGGISGIGEEWVYHIKPNKAYIRACRTTLSNNERSGVIIEVYKVADGNLQKVWRGTPKKYLEKYKH